MKTWQPITADCPHCGDNECDVLTESNGLCSDGDEVRCVCCGARGTVAAYRKAPVEIVWHTPRLERETE